MMKMMMMKLKSLKKEEENVEIVAKKMTIVILKKYKMKVINELDWYEEKFILKN
jgi:hypothetical protein